MLILLLARKLPTMYVLLYMAEAVVSILRRNQCLVREPAIDRDPLLAIAARSKAVSGSFMSRCLGERHVFRFVIWQCSSMAKTSKSLTFLIAVSQSLFAEGISTFIQNEFRLRALDKNAARPSK